MVLIRLSCYQSGHWLFLSTWARLTSKMLQTSQSFIATYEVSIITATVLVQTLSSTLSYFSFSPPSQSSSYSPVRQIWRPSDPRPAPEDHVSSRAIWRGNSLLTHMLSLTPPSAHALPPVDCVEGLKQSWQGHTV